MESKYFFEPVEINNLDMEEYYLPPNKSVFTTFEWIEYIKEDSGAEPIVIRITENGLFIGYFTGAVFKKFGVKIIASPFEGWSTCFMGFDLAADNERTEIIGELSSYLFKKYHCLYIEICDRFISVQEAADKGFAVLQCDTLELEIDKSDEELFKVFKTDCRNFIRQFERRGASIEIAEPNDVFAEEYYSQLEDVFAKQQLVPTYSLKKVKCLIRHMKDSGNILCLRVRNPEGKSIASSIFLGYKERFFFWGGASYRPEQHYRPNEYMIWTAIKYWRDRSCRIFDMVGVRDYKRKFGSHEESYAKIVIPKYKILFTLRNVAKRVFFLGIKIKGKLFRKK
ncbi:MAG: GNAT family N-acetyltransferase [Eubacterium sp.]|nr:GNAT family N-acetyltransferase [Eubacterium sp.]